MDVVKSSASDGSMDMAMMMQKIEKFPEFCEPFFYNTTPTYQEFMEPLFNVSPNVTPTQPSTLIDNNNINFITNNDNTIQQPNNTSFPYLSPEKKNSMAAMREMIFRMAVMQPIQIDPESVKPPKRRNVKISKDPQSVAARHRRERISERIRILQRLVPGGTKMDTASMLDEAIHYVKFLKKQVQTLEQAGAANRNIAVSGGGVGFNGMFSSTNFNVNYSPLLIKGCQPYQMVGSTSKQLLS